MRTISELKQHCKAVGNTFFSKGNARYFNSSKVFGIYRAPYTPDTEGYVIAETMFFTPATARRVSTHMSFTVLRPRPIMWTGVRR
jgi:hypothetical protein